MNNEERINKIKKKFPNIKILYFDKMTKKFSFECDKHGTFSKTYKSVIKSKWGCNKCAREEGCKESHRIIRELYGEKGPLANKGCIEKGKRTKLEKYGDENYCNREKAIITNKNKTEDEKNITKVRRENTFLKEYGVKNPFNIREVRIKNIESLRQQEVKDKRAKTNLIKYNSECILSSESTLRDNINKKNKANAKERALKAQSTILRRYGVKTWAQTPQGRLRLSEISRDRDVIRKRINTAKLRGTAGLSRDEEIFAKILESHSILYIREYISDLYPFKCDFYLPETDTYVELNLYWTHQGHWFNPNSKEDIETLNFLKNKSTPFYDDAIYTWTIRDILKRNTAMENKINYEVIWKREDFNSWIQKYINSNIPVSTIGDECNRVERN